MTQQYFVEPKDGGFVVRIDPPIAGLISTKMFERHREARGWASGLRLSYRGEVVDRVTDGGAHG
jgi:hypothetical protein